MFTCMVHAVIPNTQRSFRTGSGPMNRELSSVSVLRPWPHSIHIIHYSHGCVTALFPRFPLNAMSLASWRGVLADAANRELPYDLRHAIDTFGHASKKFELQLGVLVIYLALKFPTPRNEFLLAWETHTSEGAAMRVFRSLQDVARRMHQYPCPEETSEIAGPLHAHGWQKLLQDFRLVKTVR